MAQTVIGREEELGAIEAFLAAAEQGPQALVLSGEPGIGKTILWEAGVEQARERLDDVLICRGVEAEASLSFAALSELLGAGVRRCRRLSAAAAPSGARGRASTGRAGRGGS